MDRRNLEREKLLFRYSAALERGDFDTAAEVLRAAERDPALEAMLLDLNAAAASGSAYGAVGGTASAAPNVQINMERSNVMVTALPARPASRNAVSWFSLAAVITVVLFGALILSRSPMGGSDPSTGVFLGGANDGLEQSPGSVECPATVSSAEGAVLSSRPDANAPAVGLLADGAQVRVIEVNDAPAPASPEPERWAYVVASNGSGQGWVNSRLLSSSVETCPLLFAPPSLPTNVGRPDSLPPTDSAPPPGQGPDVAPVGADVTATSTPIPFPAQGNPPPGVSELQPTIVPPQGGPPPGAEAPGGVCDVTSADPVDIYSRLDAEQPLFTLNPGARLSVIVFDATSGSYQVIVQVDDVFVGGAWVRAGGVAPSEACVQALSAVQPAVAPTVVPPTVPATVLPTSTPIS